MAVQSLADVVTRLEEILAWSRRQGSRLGYFPALYCKMTRRVQEGIAAGRFDDGGQMEHIAVIFANRYLQAFEHYQRGQHPSQAWRLAFEATSRWGPIVTQHLLLGMNAHINLDLGIAVAHSVPPARLPQAQGDFNTINDVLQDLIDQVQAELALVWPLYRWLDRVTGRHDECLINFSLTKARHYAWQVAERLAVLPTEAQDDVISSLDTEITHIGRLVLHPGLLTRPLLTAIRVGERGSVADIIAILT